MPSLSLQTFSLHSMYRHRYCAILLHINVPKEDCKSYVIRAAESSCPKIVLSREIQTCEYTTRTGRGNGSPLLNSQ